MLCIYRKLWWNQHQNIRISTSASEDMSHQKIKHVLTLKSDEQNLRKTYSDSDQDPNHVISTQKRQNKLKPRTLWLALAEHSEVSTLLCIQDKLITNGFIPRQRSSQNGKNVMSIEIKLWTTTYLFQGYKNKSVRKEMANTLYAHTHKPIIFTFSLIQFAKVLKRLLYSSSNLVLSKLNIVYYHNCDI